MTDEFVEKLEKIHDDIIKRSGGELGVRDRGGLFHAAYKILDVIERHPDKAFHVAAVIYHMLATRHYFVDGNKRTAHVTAQIWLSLDGYDFKVPYEGGVNFIMSIAVDKPLREIEDWVRENALKID